MILASSLSRYSPAPKTKRIFQMLWCVFEGRGNRARPSQPFQKNCQNWHFLTHACKWNVCLGARFLASKIRGPECRYLTPCFLNYFQVILFAILHAEQLEHSARAIKLIQNQLETKPNSLDLEQKLIQLYEKLDWTHCTHFAKESLPTRFPTDFELH